MSRIKIKHVSILIILLISILQPYLGNSAYAKATKTTEELKKIGEQYSKLQTLRRCAEDELTTDGIDIGDGPFNLSFTPFGGVANKDKAIGYLVDGDDGRWDCASEDGVREDDWFQALGYTSWDGGEPTSYVNGSGHIFVAHGSYYFSQDGKDPITEEASKNFFLSQIDGKANDTIASLSENEKKALQYQILSAAFFSTEGCNAVESKGLITNSDKDKITLGGIEYTVNNDGKGVFDGEIAVGHGDLAWGDRGTASCAEVALKLSELHDAWFSVTSEKDQSAGTGTNTNTNTNTNTDTDTNTKLTCESNIPAVGWIICEAMEAAIGGLGFLETAIQNQLTFDLDNINGTGNKGSAEIRAGSDSIKIIANTAFAIGILWIVLSQAITGGGGSGFFGAYEAKKVLPKLIAGVIVANFSWDLANLMLKISNSLGAATKSIMLSPFGGNISVKIDTADTWSLGLAGLGTGVAVFFGFFAITPILITAAAAIIIGYFALIFRKAVIIALVAFAPIALVISPFAPNITKRWMNMIRNMIFMYPIIMAMISAFAIMAYLLDIQAQATTGIPSIALKLAAIACLFAPYFMIVTLFKIMGDVLGKLAGSAKSMGDGFGKNFGQRRLEGNEHRVKRELLKNARKNQMHKSAYRDLVNDARYEGKNPYKRFKKGYIAERQAQGSILTRSGREERRRTKKSNQYELTAQDEKLSLEAGQAALSAESVSSFDPSKPYVIKDKEGNAVNKKLVNKMDLQRMLAEGHTVEYKDVTGDKHTLSGTDSDVRFAAAMSLGQAGDVSQIRQLMSSGDSDSVKLAKIAVSSNESAFVAKAPDLTSKPNKIAFSKGMTYADVSGWHGSTVDQAIDFQSETANFLDDAQRLKYEEAYNKAYGLHGNESAARSAAEVAVNSSDPAAWSAAEKDRSEAQAVFRSIMDDMKNDPMRNDTRNQDKIDRYEDKMGIIL